MERKRKMREHLKKMTDDPWEGLSANGARRVDSKGKHDFFWIRMPDNSPGLLLQLASDTEEVRPLPKLKNIQVFYRIVDGRNSLCVTLNEKAEIELFQTLCRDVVSAGEQGADSQNALGRAVRRTLRWHQLLRGGKTGMSIEEQRGLVGELAFLRGLADQIGPLAAVEAWKGPDESAKDFELRNLFFEVKSRRSAAHLKVRISSEAQLTSIEGTRLFLWVQDVDTSFEASGNNLKDHVERTATLFEEDLLALDIWEQRLAETAYSADNVEETRQWHVGAARAFKVFDGFPRLVPPLPSGVEEVTYTIRLDACAQFERTADMTNLLQEGVSDV